VLRDLGLITGVCVVCMAPCECGVVDVVVQCVVWLFSCFRYDWVGFFSIQFGGCERDIVCLI
jgi:hypothetical protein